MVVWSCPGNLAHRSVFSSEGEHYWVKSLVFLVFMMNGREIVNTRDNVAITMLIINIAFNCFAVKLSRNIFE
jgi:hypothetical protein